ncbi:hypothetical protein BS333_05695 [Vibrio azureus]|uniref:ADP ribosyltransferase domain-containing protein n=1 Tax=Vibrio azureus NBRC 104587 TaxID=1219077 RepID=U3A2I3_9VIBR|nr:ADP-ribosyltransferase [Vibrio azureus]AUI85911.1 hypothetical protein BS333_05695 [Vibrio azureus]GAD74216.1 hypothetical protein VAZ01S_005_00160 [Vibrio azureus NBRC 104587]
MKFKKITTVFIAALFFSSPNLNAGLKYNSNYYKKSEINNILKEMSDPDLMDSFEYFYQERTELYRAAALQSERLSQPEVNALELYQDYAYQTTREALRTGISDEETQVLIRDMDSAFQNSIAHKGITYRGESALDAYLSEIKVGDIVSPSSFVSTSISRNYVDSFYKGQLSRFELMSGEHGIVIPTVRDDELEVLINRNSFFEVTAINTTPEGNFVIYREVPRQEVMNKSIKDMHTGEIITAKEACTF